MSTLGNGRIGRARALGATTAAAGAVAMGYAAVVERRLWKLRTAELPVLAPGTAPLRVLHVSDLHMLPRQYDKQRWVSELARLEPDLVVNTGDNLADRRSVPAVLRSLGPLLRYPGVFVFGSNDYYGPRPKNPARYLSRRWRAKRVHGPRLPWRDLRAALIEHGWHDLTQVRRGIDLGGRHVFAAGVDDPHLERDHYADISGRADRRAALRLGVTHSPEPRVLDPFAEDGYDLVLAGHTHGGQLRIPGFGALVTNCELDRTRARGASRWGARMWLHVSAGLGTSPYAPLRFACRPEATLLTLVPRDSGNAPTRSTSLGQSRIAHPRRHAERGE